MHEIGKHFPMWFKDDYGFVQELRFWTKPFSIPVRVGREAEIKLQLGS